MNVELIWDLNNLFESDNDFYAEIEEINVQLNKILELKHISLNSTNLLELLNFKWRIKEQAIDIIPLINENEL